MTATNNPMLAAALELAKDDWEVFPLAPRRKTPLLSKAQEGNGFHDATIDPTQIRAWWGACPTANIGIRPPVDVAGLDLDTYKPEYDGSLEPLLCPTREARTGSGGRHLYYRVPEWAVLEYKPAPGVEVKTHENGYLVAPPSVNEAGQPYEWVNDLPIADMPPALLERLIKPAPQGQAKVPVLPAYSSASAPQNVGRTPGYLVQDALKGTQGGDNRKMRCYWLAKQLQDNRHSLSVAETAILSYQAKVEQPPDKKPVTQEYVLSVVRYVYEHYQPREPSGYPPDQSTPVFWEGKESQAKQRQGKELIHIGGILPGEEEDWQLNDIQDENDPALAEAYREWFQKGRQADAFPSDGLVQYPGSNAQRRNASQRYVVRQSHHLVFPEAELLSDAEMSTVLNIVRQNGGAGRECVTVLDKLWHGRDGHQKGDKKPVRTPRAWPVSIVRRAMLPPPTKEEAELERARQIEQKHDDEARDQERYSALMECRGWSAQGAWDEVAKYARKPDAAWEAFLAQEQKQAQQRREELAF